MFITETQTCLVWKRRFWHWAFETLNKLNVIRVSQWIGSHHLRLGDVSPLLYTQTFVFSVDAANKWHRATCCRLDKCHVKKKKKNPLGRNKGGDRCTLTRVKHKRPACSIYKATSHYMQKIAYAWFCACIKHIWLRRVKKKASLSFTSFNRVSDYGVFSRCCHEDATNKDPVKH